MTGPLSTADLIEMDDLDGLLVRIDHLCADQGWDDLVDLRDRARRAFERGRQLWPAASHAEYRLALEAPARWAATVLVPGAAQFALGPVSEVAASTHTWEELAPHAPPTPEATLAAHERVIRGEDLTGDVRIDPSILELPLRLQPWEPDYPVAEYKAHEAAYGDPPAPEPADPSPTTIELSTPPPAGDPGLGFDGCQALADLVGAWRDESGGHVKAVAARGDVLDALATLRGNEQVRLQPLEPEAAMATMAWAAASGGAHGRRRGMAAGRFGSWWALAALTGQLDTWPPHPDDVGEAFDELFWYRWDGGHPATGWSLRLAVEDPGDGLAWALEAVIPASSPPGVPTSAR